MEKQTYYIHPADDQKRRKIVYVTYLSKDITNRRKKYVDVAFMVDLPGSWDDEKYNLHVDGCDYLYDTLDEAIKAGADFYDYDWMTGGKPGYNLVNLSTPYDWNNTQPEYYNIKF